MSQYSAILKPGYYQIGAKEYLAKKGRKLQLSEKELLHFNQWSILLWTDHPDLDSNNSGNFGNLVDANDSELKDLLPKKLQNKSWNEVRDYYHKRFVSRSYTSLESMARSVHVDPGILGKVGADAWFEGSSK